MDGRNIFALFIFVSGLFPISTSRYHFAGRFKRHVTREILDDPDHCVHRCWESNLMGDSVTSSYVKSMLHSVKNNPPERVARQTGETFSGTSAIFYSNCQTYQNLDHCFEQCPDSKLKKLSKAENIRNEEYCLPYNDGFVGFKDYYNTLSRISNAMSTDPRSKACGKSKTADNVTFLNFYHADEQERAVVYYNSDMEKNNKECRLLCKKFNAQYNCYKPILIDRCDQKGYSLYARITKIHTRSSFAMLQALNALPSNVSDCSSYSHVRVR